MKLIRLYLCLSVLLMAVFWLSLYGGAVTLSPVQALLDVWHGRPGIEALVLWEIRLPRSLLALTVGASLGLAGAAMQGLLRNPLAEPGLLGVSNGAALGAVVVLYLGASGLAWYWLPLAAISGAVAALGLVYLLAGLHASVLTLILAGVAVNAFAGALIAVALNFAPNLFAVQEIVYWLMGSLANRSYDHLALAAPLALVGAALIISRGGFLDALSLGEDSARSLGYRLTRERSLLLCGIAVSVGACVAVSGSVGFVGLVVPHLLRPLTAHRPWPLLPVSALGGAVLVLVADLLVRSLDTANELKLGVITALLGGPFFLYLIVRSRDRWV
ncbi:MAG: iron ABC transporter permease [Exilibacterium sp.]